MIYPWQQEQWQTLANLLANKRLPHAMLFTGARGLGKTALAHSLLQSVLCQNPTKDFQACGLCKSCQLYKAGTHPDIHSLKPTIPSTSNSANPTLSIKIEAVRDLCDQLNQTSQFGSYRVALLEDADFLTLSAANSLLKTLEEPGNNVLILLVTSRPQRLPVTIRSRCQILRFSIPQEEVSFNWLRQQSKASNENHSDFQLKQALKIMYGSPLAALRWLTEIEHYDILRMAMTARVSGKNSLDFASQLTNYGKVKTLEGMVSWSSDLSKILACGAAANIVNESERQHLQTMAASVNQRRLFKFQDQLNFNLLNSAIAVNEQLLWENLLLSWENL